MPQSFAVNHIHLVFSTKDRYPFLRGNIIKDELYPYMVEAVKNHHSTCIIINGMPDHIHMLLTLSSKVSLADLVRSIKRSSSTWIKDKGPQFNQFHWQNGYAAFSVSHNLIPKVRSYIENQPRHHEKKSFEDEFREFLEMQGIAYDEKYLFG